MNDIKAFIAGFLSTLVFHQGTLAIVYGGALTARAPYALTPTWPLHVPGIVSLAFSGGIWAVVLARGLRHLNPRAYWLAWIATGAILPSLVAWFVVFPLKGLPPAGDGSAPAIATALLLNGMWGLGAALFLRLVEGSRRRTTA